MTVVEVPSRLNPFAFVSDTSLRFALLVIFVVGADMFYWLSISSYILLPGPGVSACMHGVPLDAAGLRDPSRSTLAVACVRDSMFHWIPHLALGIALLAVATVGFYAASPAIREWHSKLIPVTEEILSPPINLMLQELSSVAGLRRLPSFKWAPFEGAPEAWAYGSFRTFRIGLAIGLIAEAHENPAKFRAVILHELAHIRNGDVVRVYFAISICCAFVMTALLPDFILDLVKLVRSPDLRSFLISVLFAAFTVLMLLLTFLSILRSRELYADVRATAWNADATALSTGLRPPTTVRRWRQVLNAHPDPARRRRLLHSTDDLFRLGNWDALGLGIAIGLIICMALWFVLFPVALLGLDSPTRLLVPLAPSLFVVPLGMALASIITWRSVFLSLMRGGQAIGIVRISAFIACGISVGLVTAFLPIVLASPGSPEATIVDWSDLYITISMLACGFVTLTAVLCVAFSVYLSWVAACTRAWLPVLLKRRNPGRIFALQMVLTCVLAMPWFSIVPAVGLQSVVQFAHGSGGSPPIGFLWFFALFAASFPFNLVSLPTMLSLWSWPLGAALATRRSTEAGAGDWAWLGPPPAIESPTVALYPARAALIGLAGGMAMSVLVLSVPPQLRMALAASTGVTQAVGISNVSMALAAMLVQSVIAAMAAIAVPHLRTVHAMLAANTAGLMIAVAILVYLVASGQHPNLLFSLSFIQVVLLGGLLVAIPTAWLVRGLLTVWHGTGRAHFDQRMMGRAPSSAIDFNLGREPPSQT